MRTATTLLLLIYFCVQTMPLVLAEDAVADVPPLAATGAVLEIASDASSSATSVISALPQPLRIVVTEVMWMGSNLSTADEWVELGAFSDGTSLPERDLSGWTITVMKSGVETVIARVPEGIRMSSGSVLLIANYAAAESRMSIEPHVVTTGLSLPNTQLLMRLRDASGALIDDVDDGVGAPFAGANPSGGAKASMQRIGPWGSGTVVTQWATATESCGWDDGPFIAGSPGVGACATATGSSSSLSSAASSAVETATSSASWSGAVLPEGSSSSASGSALSSANSATGAVVDPLPFASSTSSSTSIGPLVRMSEVLANPVGVDTDEWIELASFAEDPVDLTDLVLRIGTVTYDLSSDERGLLQPGEYRRFGRLQTGLPLANAGATIELLWRGRVIDTLTYTETIENVSVGWVDDELVAQCAPSPGAPNTAGPADVQVVVQSSTAAPGRLSLNLEARVEGGAMTGSQCSWIYPDGYTSLSCNPPSHSIAGPIEGDVFLEVHDYCGNTVTRTLHLEVPGKDTTKKEDVDGVLCQPSAFTGVVLSEVFPNPAGDEAAGEWVELWNPSAEEKSLCGWSIDDAKRGSMPYALDHLRLPSAERYVLPRSVTGLSFNNDTDAIRLFAPLPQGGSGAIEIVRYTAAPEGRTYARRADGAWLWTDPTPWEENIFREPEFPNNIVVQLVGALPNPTGDDRMAGEWVEVQNMTPFPFPLTRWSLRTKSGMQMLEGILAPHEVRRTALDTRFSLANTDGFVRLVDPMGVVASTLAWTTAGNDRIMRSPAPVQSSTGWTLESVVDCRTWSLRSSTGDQHVTTLTGIESVLHDECVEFISALYENKKLDLKMYSKDGSDRAIFSEGTNVVSVLLQHGLAVVDPSSPSFAPLYRFDEAEARAAKRGWWASDERAAILTEARERASILSLLHKNGLQIRSSLKQQTVAAGEILALTTNVPATLWLAEGTGAYELYDGPFTVNRDLDLRILARADVQTDDGMPIDQISFQSYSLLKSRYPHIWISEVYPSPNSGEREWVELWNPTDEPVRLAGWSIDDIADGGSKPVTLTGGVVAPRAFLLLHGLSLALNNTGDSVRLIAPNGRVMDDIAFGSVKKGMSVAIAHARDHSIAGTCMTSHPTPGQVNRCAELVKVPKKSTNALQRKPAARWKVVYRNLVEGGEGVKVVRGVFEDILHAGQKHRLLFQQPFLIGSILFAFVILLSCVFLTKLNK